MRINVAVPEAHVEAPVLDAALESVTRLNESLMERGQVPSFSKALLHGVKWKPEPPGAEHFDHAGTVIARKWGDCDDLAPYLAADLRHSGADPGATAIVKRSGPKSWHAVVRRSDGAIEDPSLRAGMRAGIPHGVRGAVLPLMFEQPQGVHGAYIVRPQIAVRPVRGGFQARADMPWHWREHLSDKPTPTDYALTALHTAPLAHTALTGAIDGACELAECSGASTEDHINRMCALSDAIEGVDFDELAQIYGDEAAEAASQVVGAFGFLKHLNPLKAVSVLTHNPLAQMASNFIPGGRAALDLANQAQSMMPGGGAHHAANIPGAPSFPAAGSQSHVPTKTRGTYRIIFE